MVGVVTGFFPDRFPTSRLSMVSVSLSVSFPFPVSNIAFSIPVAVSVYISFSISVSVSDITFSFPVVISISFSISIAFSVTFFIPLSPILRSIPLLVSHSISIIPWESTGGAWGVLVVVGVGVGVRWWAASNLTPITPTHIPTHTLPIFSCHPILHLLRHPSFRHTMWSPIPWRPAAAVPIP